MSHRQRMAFSHTWRNPLMTTTDFQGHPNKWFECHSKIATALMTNGPSGNIRTFLWYNAVGTLCVRLSVNNPTLRNNAIMLWFVWKWKTEISSSAEKQLRFDIASCNYSKIKKHFVLACTAPTECRSIVKTFAHFRQRSRTMFIATRTTSLFQWPNRPRECFAANVR